MNRTRIQVVCAARLHANQLERHLELFEHVEEVEAVHVVRHAECGARLGKVVNHTFSDGTRAGNAVRMARTLDRVLREYPIGLVVGFNPVPWGALAHLTARRRKVPTFLGLIGRDYLQLGKAWGYPFLEAVRGADAVTVTGERMRTGLISKGVLPERIQILPHSVDTARFSPSDEEPEFDVLSVGQLIERKRMDVLLSATALLVQRGLRPRVGILGKGPLEGDLREQVHREGLEGYVTFLGYRDDVEAVLKTSKLFCLCSEWEGVPFAMMEAMSSGLVPVVTDVGTIGDWIDEGQNGCLLPVGDSEALASKLETLITRSSPEYDRMRRNVLADRERLSFDAGASVLRSIVLSAVEPGST